ncbi:hypothetical protein H0W26_06165, partial [Candidatus Dependentiae bacterium]|nr:hypothetical protein [Candidatus Dependentiae bacterium]
MKYLKNCSTLTLCFFKEKIVTSSFLMRFSSSFFIPIVPAVVWYLLCYRPLCSMLACYEYRCELLYQAKNSLSKKVSDLQYLRNKEENLRVAARLYFWSPHELREKVFFASLRALTGCNNLSIAAYGDQFRSQGKLPFVVSSQQYTIRG